MKKTKDTNYNNQQIKRVSTKTVQVQQEEYIKCKKGEEFKVRVITHTKPKVTLDDIMDQIIDIKVDIKHINGRLDKHDLQFEIMKQDIRNINDRLGRNNLKP